MPYKMMRKFVLLGIYGSKQTNGVEVVATSDDCDELTKTWNTINLINQELHHPWQTADNPRLIQLIDTLPSPDIVDSHEGYIHEISIVGTFRLERCAEVSCATCGKVLSAGRERGKVVHCADCAR